MVFVGGAGEPTKPGEGAALERFLRKGEGCDSVFVLLSNHEQGVSKR